MREVNPFEDPQVAEEWITSVEGEEGLIRDREIYPRLIEWAAGFPVDGKVVEIGSGQGICSQHLGNFKGEYIGVEPSKRLVDRAEELYSNSDDQLNFLVGNAYELPLKDNEADGVFSVNVWFHLANLQTTTKELARVLKNNGRYLIITANPNSYDTWRSFYENADENEKVISGKVNTPVNPLSRNDFYLHSYEELVGSLTDAGLTVDSTSFIGNLASETDKPLFISIEGTKQEVE